MIRQLSLYYWFAALLILALVTGFTASSRGRFFNRAAGQVLNGLLVWIMLAIIVAVFMFHGWKAAAFSLLAAFVIGALGQSLFDLMVRKLWKG